MKGSRTSGSSCLPAGSPFIIKDVPSYRPIGLVAAQIFVRRWPLYLASCAAVFGLEALFCRFVHVRFASFYAELIGSPLISAVVLVNVGCDAAQTLQRRGERLERILERAWAIIVIDVCISLVMKMGLESMSSADAGDIFLGIAVMFLAAMLAYAEPYAALEEGAATLTVVPLAILRSMMLAWVNISRIFSLFAIQIALSIAEIALLKAVAGWGEQTLATLDLAYVALATAPLSALFAIAYLDTLAQERRTSP